MFEIAIEGNRSAPDARAFHGSRRKRGERGIRDKRESHDRSQKSEGWPNRLKFAHIDNENCAARSGTISNLNRAPCDPEAALIPASIFPRQQRSAINQ